MPPVVNPVKQETMLTKTNESPFNMSGFAPANTFVSKLSKASEQPTQPGDSLVSMCEHAKTDNVKVISDILLQQVENLSKTDRTYQTNLEIAGGSLEKIRFVRGANYLHQMSDIVQRQEKEIALQQTKIDKSDSLLDENQMLKEKVQELQIEVTRLR